jgi:hypothetical protein
MKAAPFAALCAGLALVPTAPPAALAAGGAGADTAGRPASRLEMAMTLYAGGITMGQMTLDASVRGTDYHAVSTLETSGVVNAFWQSQIQATSSGKLSGKTLEPALYDSFYTGKAGKKQEVSLTYEAGAAPKLFADPVYATTGFEVKPDDVKSTLDPLSAITFLFSGVAGAPCTATAPIFDGRRRYNIEMAKLRDVDIKMDNGLYAGKGVECTARYRQIAGFRPRVLKNNESFPVIHAWFVTVPSAVAGRDYTVPVRIWADTKYGVLAILATSLKVDGETPKGAR